MWKASPRDVGRDGVKVEGVFEDRLQARQRQRNRVIWHTAVLMASAICRPYEQWNYAQSEILAHIAELDLFGRLFISRFFFFCLFGFVRGGPRKSRWLISLALWLAKSFFDEISRFLNFLL